MPVLVSAVVLVVVSVVALSLGRYPVPISHVVQSLTSGVLPWNGQVSDTEWTVVVLVRLPRILLAILVGGGLGIAGRRHSAIRW